jgi:hypothetical protein
MARVAPEHFRDAIDTQFVDEFCKGGIGLPKSGKPGARHNGLHADNRQQHGDGEDERNVAYREWSVKTSQSLVLTSFACRVVGHPVTMSWNGPGC